MAKLWKNTKDILKEIPAGFTLALVLTTVIMNLMANKAISFASITINGNMVNFVDCGTLLSWIVFLVMDITTKKYGPKKSTHLAIFALCINLLVVAVFSIISYLPGNWVNEETEIMNTFFRCNWAIVVGSSLAFIVGAITNNFSSWLIGEKIKKNPDNFKAFITRSYISTTIGQFVDNFIFSFTAFYLFQLILTGSPWYSIYDCLISATLTMLCELLFEVVFSPLGYKILKNMDNNSEASIEKEQRTNLQRDGER